MNFTKIKNKLNEYGIDAYVIYDFRGSNFLGRAILGFSGMTTRKFASVLTKTGAFHIISKMEAGNYTQLKGKKYLYTSYSEFGKFLGDILKDKKTIAVDTSGENELPIVDLTPSGFIDLVKKLNPRAKIVSSENLSQSLAAVWGKQGYKSHKVAAHKLTKIFEKTFRYIKQSLKKGTKLTDYEAMEYAVDLQKKKRLHSDGENLCIIASGKDTTNPHYWPVKEAAHPLTKNSPLLVDMWARTHDKESVYADFTMYAWVGPDPAPEKLVNAWQVWKEARDIGVAFIKERIRKELKGFEVDNKIRTFLNKKGYAGNILHRSGHSLGQKEHGNGANLDNFETHDTRLVLPDTGMTIEPGLYLKDYGVRGEIDLYIHPNLKVEVTTPLQEDLIII